MVRRLGKVRIHTLGYALVWPRHGSRQVFFKFNKVMNCLQKYKEKFTNVSFVGFLRYLCNENEGER